LVMASNLCRMHMRRIRQCFLMSFLVCTAPFAAHAQEPPAVHAWRLTISGCTYGLVQWQPYRGIHQSITTIYLGSYTHTIHTSLPAPCVATVILLPVATLGFFAATGLFRQKR